MNKFGEFLVNTFLPMVEQVGEGKLVDLLQKFHDADEEKYKATMQFGHAFIQPLVDFAASTETKIDDGFVEAISDALTISAVKNGITF